MKKVCVFIFTPRGEDFQLLSKELSEEVFNNFRIEIVETGPGLINTATKCREVLGPFQGKKDKVLLAIGAGLCNSLNLALRAGDSLCGHEAILGDWATGIENTRTYGPYSQVQYEALSGSFAEEIRLKSLSALSLELLKRLNSKGFLPSCIFSSNTLITARLQKVERGRHLNCHGSDMESGALAWVAESLDIPWLNIRIISDTLDDELKSIDAPEAGYHNLLPLKLLVALSTLDLMPKPSTCSNCSNPCGSYFK